MSFNTRDDSEWSPLPPDAEGLVIPPVMGGIIKWGLVIIALIFLFVGISYARGVYTDWLWFDHLGFKSVFVKILTTKIWLFFSGALVIAGILAVNIVIANRFSRGEETIPLPPESIALLRRLVFWGTVLAVIIIAIIFGSITSGRWETFLRFMNSVPFNDVDPLYSKDISFYAFKLPVYNFIQGWFLGAAIVTLLVVGGIYFMNFSLRGIGFPITPSLRVHVSILGAFLMATVAASHLLDIWELVFSAQGAIVGAAYTDVHARLPALRFLTAIAAASGVLMLVNAYLRGIRLAAGALALWMVSAIIIGVVYPGIVQRFQVQPNEFAKEQKYIGHNIAFTRKAFALDRIEEQAFPAGQEVSDETIQQNPQTVSNIRLWDHRPLKDTYNQIQFIRLYYDFLDVDVDRYIIDGEYKQVMLAARELAPEKLPQEAQRWVNQKLQYTHGLGVAISPVTEFTPEGRPVFFVQDVPPRGDIPLDRPQIYYGENTKGFVIVNTKTREFDYPTPEDIPVYTSYTGRGGVQLSSFIRRLAYTWQLADINILISGELTSESRIQYRRQIQERVSAIAPFLLLDHDPYIVVADGALFWIQDAYTVTDRYPYSDPFADSFNYMRNSVKVVIDAFEGSVSFYVADSEDALIKTYEKMFPDLFLPLEEMPPSLREHIRYPEDFFAVQAQKYLAYHMRENQVFYNKEDQWSIPNEKFGPSGTLQPIEPYYVIMRLPQEEVEEFVLLLPFTPSNKPNMVGWLAARSDGENYGKLQAFQFPKDRQIDGPEQIEARIDNDPDISEWFTLRCKAGSLCIRGNLLVIPIGESLLYAEPIYLQAEGVNFPELKTVILASGNRVVMESSLSEALASLTGAIAGTEMVTPQPGQPGTTGPPGEGAQTTISSEDLQRLSEAIEGLKENLSKLEEALKGLQEPAGGF